MSTIKVDTITDEAGTGAPTFSTGAAVTGNLTASGTITATGTITGGAFSGSGAGLTGIDAFKPVAVTGATPSLDVGSYNFFNNGTITADTTVSFTNVPTNAKWSYTFKPAISLSPWDLTAHTFLQKLDVSSSSSGTKDIYFKPDGTKFYLADAANDKVQQFDLSTAWDISTATYFGGIDVSPRESAVQGVFFKDDGTKMYMTGITNDAISEYNLSTAWNITTATYYQDFSLSSQDSSPTGIYFAPDGTKLFVAGSSNQNIIMYTLSTAWDISTLSFSQNFSVSLDVKDIYFKDGGLTFYVLIGSPNSSGNEIREYTTPNAYSIGSNEVYVRSVYVTASQTTPRGLFFDGDGEKMYVADSNNDVYEYDLGGIATVTLPSSVENAPVESIAIGKRVTYDFFTTDGGTTVTLIGEDVI